jgi:hypothetical protein
MKDLNLWKAALAGRWNATFRSFPALNHLFIAGQGKSVPAEYAQPCGRRGDRTDRKLDRQSKVRQDTGRQRDSRRAF